MQTSRVQWSLINLVSMMNKGDLVANSSYQREQIMEYKKGKDVLR